MLPGVPQSSPGTSSGCRGGCTQTGAGEGPGPGRLHEMLLFMPSSRVPVERLFSPKEIGFGIAVSTRGTRDAGRGARANYGCPRRDPVGPCTRGLGRPRLPARPAARGVAGEGPRSPSQGVCALEGLGLRTLIAGDLQPAVWLSGRLVERGIRRTSVPHIQGSPRRFLRSFLTYKGCDICFKDQVLHLHVDDLCQK